MCIRDRYMGTPNKNLYLPMEELKVNKQIDNYVYNDEEPLAKGQFGSVFKGYDIEGDRIVAIKVITTKLITNSYLAQLLNNEIEVLKKVHSPYIVSYIDLRTTRNNIYIITEFCDGGDLSKLILRRGSLPEVEVVEILRQVVEALREMQRHNVIHRDLKPANVLLHQGKVKLADLGFARTVENFQGSILNSTVGSPMYMSPQLLTKAPYTSKCDIWSLGIILYQLLYGVCPWRAPDIAALTRKIQTEPLEFKPGVAVSDKMKSVILRCLSYDEPSRISLEELITDPLLTKSDALPTQIAPGEEEERKSKPAERLISDPYPGDNDDQRRANVIPMSPKRYTPTIQRQIYNIPISSPTAYLGYHQPLMVGQYSAPVWPGAYATPSAYTPAQIPQILSPYSAYNYRV
eukprot:TRINITY_DN7829_c0_g1_i1.p1 TRINITY_DN7829_c0_g1~~TRINITY_DN7829_c0_g1_i1.p1  ORF type:complete len:404 (-),score=37.64 TRINITY_DN7829_c0_g1_i1:127-1338(-)